MAAKHNAREQRLRQYLAQEAARIMAEEGVQDYLLAKRKAADRLDVPSDAHYLPRNTEIEQALAEYHRIFKSSTQPRHLQALRNAALHAMAFFARFQPRLVGSVLTGLAGEHSDINLHLFAETPEEVALFLIQEGIPYESAHRRVRMDRDTYRDVPSFRFKAEEDPIELVVFPLDGLRQAPWSPVDGRPMQRASRSAVEALLLSP